MTVARRILGEPLLHFLVAGVVIFTAYSILDRSTVSDDKHSIEVGKGQLSQLVESFTRTWQRPPTEAELRGLIDGYVKEEVFYREGQEMGLDQDDTIFRRRMQQKLEFLLEPSAEELTPRSGELEAYFNEHSGRYDRPMKLAFQQLFFSSTSPGDHGEMAARAALSNLRSGLHDDKQPTPGDATTLPLEMPLTDTKEIAAVFGHDFVVGAATGAVGQWSEPVRSSYGVHLVFLDQKTATEIPALVDVQDEVQLDWENDRRKEITDRRYAEMKSRYEITITWPASEAAALISTSGVE